VAQPQELHADVFASLARHEDRALRLRCESQELLAATRETVTQSRALIAEANTCSLAAQRERAGVAGVLIGG
jgi:hypothetical protein